jgi:hypothetical protein
MTRLLKTNKVTTVEYGLEDVRVLLAENAEEALGPADDGFERQVHMKTVFHVDRGNVVVTGFQLTIQDSANEAPRRKEDVPALFQRHRS